MANGHPKSAVAYFAALRLLPHVVLSTAAIYAMIFFDIFDALKHFHRENRHAWLTVISSISVLLFFDGTSGGAGFLVPLQGLESWRYWYGFGYPLASIFLLRGSFRKMFASYSICLFCQSSLEISKQYSLSAAPVRMDCQYFLLSIFQSSLAMWRKNSNAGQLLWIKNEECNIFVFLFFLKISTAGSR